MTTLKGLDVGNLDSAPIVLPPDGRFGGTERVWMGNVPAETTDLDASDVIVMVRVPSDIRLTEIKLGADNLGSALTVDVGVYETDGTVVDANEFATAFVLDSAVFAAATNLLYQADATQLGADLASLEDGHGERLWERLELSEDPKTYYDICLTVVTSTSPAAGDIAWTIKGVLGGY